MQTSDRPTCQDAEGLSTSFLLTQASDSRMCQDLEEPSTSFLLTQASDRGRNVKVSTVLVV